MTTYQHHTHLVCIIAQGLLASGHYTNPPHPEASLEDRASEPRVTTWDAGEDWKDGTMLLRRRHNSHVVEDAINLYEEIKEALGYENIA